MPGKLKMNLGPGFTISLILFLLVLAFGMHKCSACASAANCFKACEGAVNVHYTRDEAEEPKSPDPTECVKICRDML